MIWRLSYRLIRAVSSAQFFIARRASRAGLFVLGGIVVSGALGIDTAQTMAYQIFTLLVALTLVALAVSFRFCVLLQHARPFAGQFAIRPTELQAIIARLDTMNTPAAQ